MVHEVRMRRRRILYGWLRSPGEWCLSRLPPDVPVPYQLFPSMEEAEQTAKASRYEVIWSGPALAEREQIMASREQHAV